MPISHLEVIAPNSASAFGVVAGQLLAVVRETPCYFYVRTFSGGALIKVRKATGRAVGYSGNGPVFNV